MKLKELYCVSNNIDVKEYIKFREKVKRRMEHPDWLGDIGEKGTANLLNKRSKVWIYYLNDEPVCSMMLIRVNKEMLLELDLQYNCKDVVEYGPMFVNPKYVGNGLQYQMLLELDNYCKQLGYKYAVGTIHYGNIYSISNAVKDNFMYIGTKTLHRGMVNIYFKKY